MGYQWGRTLTREALLEQVRRDEAHAKALARAEAKGRRQAEAKQALAETIRAAKALNIPPHPDGYHNRLTLDREVAAYNRQKAGKHGK